MSQRKSYPSDLTEEEWTIIRPLLPKRWKNQPGAQPRVCRRVILDAIFYILRTGCQWRQLPHDFPAWGTVSSQFYRWRRGGVWERIHHALHARVRELAGRNTRPTAGSIDSQSVKRANDSRQRGAALRCNDQTHPETYALLTKPSKTRAENPFANSLLAHRG